MNNEKNIAQLVKKQENKKNLEFRTTLSEYCYELKKEQIELIRLQDILIAHLETKSNEFWNKVELDAKIKH